MPPQACDHCQGTHLPTFHLSPNLSPPFFSIYFLPSGASLHANSDCKIILLLR